MVTSTRNIAAQSQNTIAENNAKYLAVVEADIKNVDLHRMLLHISYGTQLPEKTYSLLLKTVEEHAAAGTLTWDQVNSAKKERVKILAHDTLRHIGYGDLSTDECADVAKSAEDAFLKNRALTLEDIAAAKETRKSFLENPLGKILHAKK
jgi:hypothetical protein